MLVGQDGNDLLIDTFDGVSAYVIDASGSVSQQAMNGKPFAFAEIDDAEPMPSVANFPAQVGRHAPALKDVISWFSFAPSVISASALGLVLRCWFVAQFMRHLMPTRPLLFVTAKGIGATKTSFARALGRLLLGDEFEVSGVAKSEDDQNVEMASVPYHVIDNIETAPRWLTTALARASTGGKPKKRKLFSDGKIYKIKLDVFVALTSATPEFLTGFLLDRMIIARMVKPTGPRIPERQLQERLAKVRPKVLAEVIAVVAETHRRIQANGIPMLKDDIRMADFAAVGWVLAEVMDGPGAGAEFVQALVDMQGERVVAASNTDPVLGALYEIAKANPEPMGAQHLINELTTVMGAQPAYLALGGDPTRLGKAIAAIRTRSAGLVDIDVSHPGGVAKYTLRVSGGGGGGRGGGSPLPDLSLSSGPTTAAPSPTPTTPTAKVEMICGSCGSVINIGDPLYIDLDAGLAECGDCAGSETTS